MEDMNSRYGSVLKWNGQRWNALANLLRGRQTHTTIIYSGEIYHIGGWHEWIGDETHSYMFTIEKWSEETGSTMVLEGLSEHPFSYVIPILNSSLF